MLTEINYKPTLADHCMKISNDKGLRPTLFGVLMLAAFAVSAGKTAGSAETAKSAKFPAPKIDGFWQASGAMRPVFVFGRHFQPAGATVPRVKIGGKAQKLCPDCADRAREAGEIAEASEGEMQRMMGFKGRR